MLLYHATSASNLSSILENGLLTSHYGRVHGRMDYAPPAPAVYLSRHEHSNNLHSSLFEDGGDSVIVLKIDSSYLDATLMFPDDAFFYMLDSGFNYEEADCSITQFVLDCGDDFSEQFGLSKTKGKRLLREFCKADGTDASYAPIAKQMAREYLESQGEIAYLGDLPPDAFVGWYLHPDSPCRKRTEKAGLRNPSKTERQISIGV